MKISTVNGSFFIFHEAAYAKSVKRPTTMQSGRRIFPTVGADEKLLIPANFITKEANGSVKAAARSIPIREPIRAVIPKLTAKESRRLPEPKPIAL